MEEKLSLAEKSFVHILNVVNYLPNNPHWNKLKVGYASKYTKQQGKLSTAKQFEKTLTNCPECLVAFNENTKIVKIVPEKKRRFASRLLKKAESNKPLTKYQKKYFKKMDKHIGNIMVVKCAVCKAEVKRNLTKPPRIKKTKQEPCVETPKSKKKRRRDRFSGLKQEAVLSASMPDGAQNNKHMVAGMKNSIKNKMIEKKKELLVQKKKKAKANVVLSKLSETLKTSKNTSTSSLHSFLSSL